MSVIRHNSNLYTYLLTDDFSNPVCRLSLQCCSFLPILCTIQKRFMTLLYTCSMPSAGIISQVRILVKQNAKMGTFSTRPVFSVRFGIYRWGLLLGRLWVRLPALSSLEFWYNVAAAGIRIRIRIIIRITLIII